MPMGLEVLPSASAFQFSAHGPLRRASNDRLGPLRATWLMSHMLTYEYDEVKELQSDFLLLQPNSKTQVSAVSGVLHARYRYGRCMQARATFHDEAAQLGRSDRVDSRAGILGG